MRTLLRTNPSFGTPSKKSRFSEYLSPNSSSTSLHKPSMTESNTNITSSKPQPKSNSKSKSKPKSKKWFSPPSSSPFPNKKTKNHPTQPSVSQASTYPQASISTHPSSPPSTQTQPHPQPKLSKRTKAWQATKSFLSSLGEPPTAEYDRQQAVLRKAAGEGKEGNGNRNGREAFGAVNYGPYHQGGPWNGGRI